MISYYIKENLKYLVNTIGIDYKKMTMISQDIEKQNFKIDLDIIKITKIALKRNINLYNESFEEICQNIKNEKKQ